MYGSDSTIRLLQCLQERSSCHSVGIACQIILFGFFELEKKNRRHADVTSNEMYPKIGSSAKVRKGKSEGHSIHQGRFLSSKLHQLGPTISKSDSEQRVKGASKTNKRNGLTRSLGICSCRLASFQRDLGSSYVVREKSGRK